VGIDETEKGHEMPLSPRIDPSLKHSVSTKFMELILWEKALRVKKNP
jgi:hypothetical protein